MAKLARLYLGKNTRARIDEIGQHYAKEDPDLARRAVHALVTTLDGIKADSEQGEVVRGMLPGHRKVQAKPFPYWVIYKVEEEQNEGFVVDIRHSKHRTMKPKAVRRAAPEPVQPDMPRPGRKGSE
jgi:plasmid stabilization system protein ParE